MALKLKPITLKNGIRIEEPYFKVTLVSYNDELKELSYAGACYYSEETKNNNCKPIEELRTSGNYAFEDKNADLFAEIYRHLKEKAEEVKDMTVEDIMKHNDNEFCRVAGSMEAPKGILDPYFVLLKDAEDC